MNIHPSVGESGAELAALQVPGVRITPAQVATDDPPIQQVIEVLGYERGPEMLKTGLKREAGKTMNPGLAFAHGTLSTSARVMGGNRGGPLCLKAVDQVAVSVSRASASSDAEGHQVMGAIGATHLLTSAAR